ncbi:MAG: hypothetical protein ACRDM0_00365 [Thermoleophilaceae bacterium]
METLFWGPGNGRLALDDEAVRVLRAAQPALTSVSARTPFGTDRRGGAIGLRGTYLTLGGNLADEFIRWIRRSASASN